MRQINKKKEKDKVGKNIINYFWKLYKDIYYETKFSSYNTFILKRMGEGVVFTACSLSK